MIPGAFTYHRPDTVDQAVALLGEFGDDAEILAGGHSLVPMMKLRLAQPGHLVDLGRIAEMRRIERAGKGEIVIGAMVRQAEIIASDLLAESVPILRETALQIADPQVRNMGTIGGNVANGDPGNDMPAVMQALDARFELRGPDGSRQVAARSFYEGAFATARADGEVLTAIHIPAPAAGHGWAYEKQKRKVGDYATAAAALLLETNGETCSKAAIALTNLDETPLLIAEAADALIGSKLESDAVEAAVRAATARCAPAADARGPVEFRTHVAGVMLRRAIAKARERAGRTR